MVGIFSIDLNPLKKTMQAFFMILQQRHFKFKLDVKILQLTVVMYAKYM